MKLYHVMVMENGQGYERNATRDLDEARRCVANLRTYWQFDDVWMETSIRCRLDEE